MAYEYDVYLSYRRSSDWHDWVHRQFLPVLRFWVGEELGREVRVFADDVLPGEDFSAEVAEVARALARSRIMVALWSRAYFASPICTSETGLMLARQRLLGLGTPQRPGGLILPVLVHGGLESVPESLRIYQVLRLEDVAGLRLTESSPRAEQLQTRVRDFSVRVSEAIFRAPDQDPAWENLSPQAFVEEIAPSAGANVAASLWRAAPRILGSRSDAGDFA